MIHIIGLQKTIILAILVTINVVLLYVSYFSLSGQIEIEDRQLRSINSQINGLTGQLSVIQGEFSKLEEQNKTFQALRAKGFLSSQDRIDAQRIFKDVLEESGVLSARAAVQGGETYDNAEAEKSNHKMLSSPITIELQALDDVDVFRYIDLLQRKFIGFVNIRSLEIERTGEVSRESLGAIIQGENPEMVYAVIKGTWKTMIPEDSVLDIQNSRNNF